MKLSHEMRRVVDELRQRDAEIETYLWTSPSIVGPDGFYGRVSAGTLYALERRGIIERSPENWHRWRLAKEWSNPLAKSSRVR